MRLKKRYYKVDLWSYNDRWYSAYYRPWWWPFWLRCVGGQRGMCSLPEEAEAQAIRHASREYPKYLDL